MGVDKDLGWERVGVKWRERGKLERERGREGKVS